MTRRLLKQPLRGDLMDEDSISKKKKWGGRASHGKPRVPRWDPGIRKDNPGLLEIGLE